MLNALTSTKHSLKILTLSVTFINWWSTQHGTCSYISWMLILGIIKFQFTGLDLENCTFAVQASKFFGFYLLERVSRDNPNKCNSITKMETPSINKRIMKMKGMLITLNGSLPDLPNMPISSISS